MKTSEQVNELSAALAKAQASMKPALKSSANPYFKSKYADLTSVWEACRGPLTSNGLSVWQDVTTDAESVLVSTRIAHTSGQWVEHGPLAMPLVKRDPQSVGSAISYGKRYALSAAVGMVADEDDDGEAAMGRKPAGNGHQAQRQLPDDVPDDPALVTNADVAEIMAVAKKQYGGRGLSSKTVAAHIDSIARGLGADSLNVLPREHKAAVIDAIQNGSTPE